MDPIENIHNIYLYIYIYIIKPLDVLLSLGFMYL